MFYCVLNNNTLKLSLIEHMSLFVSTDSISQADTEVASDHPNQQQQQPQIQQH